MDDYKTWLPPVNPALTISLPHFPNPAAAVVFRLWEMVPAEKLAETLMCDAADVRAYADAMGLPPQRDTAVWRERGYITILRAVWHLLPYDQIMTLLDVSRAELAFILKEDDFLSHKFGNAKFPGSPVRLTDTNTAALADIRRAMDTFIRPYDAEETAVPFDFFRTVDAARTSSAQPAGTAALTDAWRIDDRTDDPDCAVYAGDFADELRTVWGVTLSPSGTSALTLTLDPALSEKPEEYHILDIRTDGITLAAGHPMGILRGLYFLLTLMDTAGGPYLPLRVRHRTPAFDARFIYSYCGLYGAPLDVDTRVSFPDALLRAYARAGVNGVWLQGVLYKLTPFPFDPALSEGYEQRLERLRELIARAKRYGLRVYLYINEPRAMPKAFFEKYPDLKGFERNELASLCTSHPAVQNYLRDSIRCLCEQAPGLGGFFTISVSENQTNCFSHSTQEKQTCPRCKSRTRAEVVAEVNSLIADTAHAVDPRIRTIIWTWGWKGFGHDEMHRAISLLSKNCILQNTSEENMDIVKAGIPLKVVDYTLSNIPPSQQSLECWKTALATGHKTSAKVQINTTWEASTAPYIPVYENVCRYMENLRAAGVGNIQLSWTLGGWPSENLKIAAAYFFDEETPFTYTDALKAAYGSCAETVRAAVHRFCNAFAEFPFHVSTLYTGPQNAGPANLLFERPTGLTATMTCYAYDDLESWRSIYPVDVFIEQLRKLSDGWREGLTLLDGMPACEFTDVAQVCGALFEASYNQARFVTLRDAYLKTPTNALKAELRNLVTRERELAVETYRVMLRNAAIGYEAANHYYFSRASMWEKVVNCEYLLRTWLA
ncbi:MAG: hypothetical protein GX929_09235 [Clostridiales bacterium]|nr:hypothetical protein [Clostridiales bacterium]